MFMSGGLEEAPTVGSGSWYTGSLSFFVKGESFFAKWPSLLHTKQVFESFLDGEGEVCFLDLG